VVHVQLQEELAELDRHAVDRHGVLLVLDRRVVRARVVGLEPCYRSYLFVRLQVASYCVPRCQLTPPSMTCVLARDHRLCAGPFAVPGFAG